MQHLNFSISPDKFIENVYTVLSTVKVKVPTFKTYFPSLLLFLLHCCLTLLQVH